ncbi:MAG: MoaD/ThiS family protein [Neisseriaceae bacterium]|nr:MoaD/ThiS family protein [Neisseriaceae bacterium]MBP6861964.1 MoaD/ThiS family protein [Neisseriaceae bacterium]
MIHLIYFGVLKQQLGLAQESLDWPGGTRDELLALLRGRGHDWAEALAPERIFRLVVNKQITQGNVSIPHGAEVALLPPVTGG